MLVVLVVQVVLLAIQELPVNREMPEITVLAVQEAQAVLLVIQEMLEIQELLEVQVTEEQAVLLVLREIQEQQEILVKVVDPETEEAAVQEVMKRHKLKMPAIAIPLRVAVFGLSQTPSLAHVLALAALQRLRLTVAPADRATASLPSAASSPTANGMWKGSFSALSGVGGHDC